MCAKDSAKAPVIKPLYSVRFCVQLRGCSCRCNLLRPGRSTLILLPPPLCSYYGHQMTLTHNTATGLNELAVRRCAIQAAPTP